MARRSKQVIARESRISLVIGDKEQRFTVAGNAGEVGAVFEFLESWMRSLPPPDLSVAINDLCTRYSVDLAALSREASMDWDDLAKLAADPLVTIGSATVNYPVSRQPEGRRRAARDDDGQGGGGSRLPPRRQAFRLSVRRSRCLSPRSTS